MARNAGPACFGISGRHRPEYAVNTGVIFTGGTKLAEHGGFNEDDVHTALLVSFPRLQAQTVKGAVTNQTGCGDHRARARARPQ
jgi:hypothetical protein